MDKDGQPLVAVRMVNELRPFSLERRRELAENPWGKAPEELNRLAPEINEIEVRNAAAGEPRNPLRVAAWNLERGRCWREAAVLIREHPALRSPDVLLLNEMDLGMARSGNLHTTRALAEALDLNYAYGVEFLELTGGDAEERERFPGENEWGYHGNAILSRLPFQEVRLIRFPGIGKWYRHFEKRLGGRMALLAKVDCGCGLLLDCVHLESGREEAEAARLEQITMLAEQLNSWKTPVILGGDFNTVPRSPVLSKLRQEDFLVEETNNLSAATYYERRKSDAALSDYRLDYICVRGLTPVREAGSPAAVAPFAVQDAERKLLSDHAAVTVKAALPE